VAATASFLDARANGGEWLVRVEDVDSNRAQPQATDQILRTLEAFGFTWDGEVVRQSERISLYERALDILRERGLAFPCSCSRKTLAMSGRLAEDGVAWYPGTCRNGISSERAIHETSRSWRFRVDDQPVTFQDRCFGRIECSLESSIGDFVVFRADGLFAYQLAVVVDDADQGITTVVRGADLLMSTPRQIALQRALGYRTPTYLHVPVAVDKAGRKLSKQTSAAPLEMDPTRELFVALQFLGQSIPMELARASLKELWGWAIAHWSPENIPKERQRHWSQSKLESSPQGTL
jgi:glutamyl-Q tRNA(Asp) synthetase